MAYSLNFINSLAGPALAGSTWPLNPTPWVHPMLQPLTMVISFPCTPSSKPWTPVVSAKKGPFHPAACCHSLRPRSNVTSFPKSSPDFQVQGQLLPTLTSYSSHHTFFFPFFKLRYLLNLSVYIGSLHCCVGHQKTGTNQFLPIIVPGPLVQNLVNTSDSVNAGWMTF